MLAVLGLAIGSFLNVCIARLPNPSCNLLTRSHCPQCNRKIFWRDLIPIFSFVFLGGRCRWCGTKISWQYPFVEILTAGIMVLLFYKFGLTWGFVFYCCFSALLIVIAFIDFNHYLIFNRTIVIGLILAIIAVAFIDTRNWIDVLLGAVVGGGLIWCIGLFGRILFKRESMGAGDIKLGILLGIALGSGGTVITLISAVVLAALVGITGIVFRKMSLQQKLPFGLFLSLGAIIYMLWGNYLTAFLKAVYGLS